MMNYGKLSIKFLVVDFVDAKKRSDVLCLLLCGGRIPHSITLFFFLETPEFNCVLCFIEGDVDLIVEHRG